MLPDQWRKADVSNHLQRPELELQVCSVPIQWLYWNLGKYKSEELHQSLFMPAEFMTQLNTACIK